MLQKRRFTYKLFRQLLFPHTYQDSLVQPKCPNMQISFTSYIYLTPYVIFLSSFIGILFGKVPWLVDSDSISTQCQYIDIIVNKKCMNSVLQYEYKFTTFQAIPNPKKESTSSVPIIRSTCTLFLAAHVVVTYQVN